MAFAVRASSPSISINGSLPLDIYSSRPRTNGCSFGYSVAFLTRQKLLMILYNRLPNHEKKVLTDQCVLHVSHEQDQVRVETAREVFYGDLVVGADGVHSVTRREMWKLRAPEQAPESEKGKHYIYISRQLLISSLQTWSSRIACIYGISSSHPLLTPVQQFTCYNNGWSMLIIVGQNGRIFWFLLLQLDQQYTYLETPRFSAEDAAAYSARLRGKRCWETVTFGEIWDRREISSMTPLEEMVFRQWSCQRMVCIGDSMHKVRRAPLLLSTVMLMISGIVCPQPRAGSQLCNRRCSSPG